MLALTLEHLAAIDYPNDFEVIVVDDAGGDRRTEATLARLDAAVPATLLTRERGGAARARNAGAEVAQGDLLLFLDDDMLVAPDHLARHAETHARFAPAMVGSWRWYSDRALSTLLATPFGRYRVQLERRFMDELEEADLGAECVEATILAANDLSIARAAFEDLAGFDEAYPHAGAEDQDLSIRARRAGLRLVRNKSIQPRHEEDIVTLEKFAWREERGGETVAVLGQRFPGAVGAFSQNDPVGRGDPPGLVAKKLVKQALSRRLALAALHRVVSAAEILHLPEPLLRRLYAGVIALHIQRGYRRALVTRA